MILYPKGSERAPGYRPEGEVIMDYVMFRLLDHFMVHTLTAKQAAKRLGEGARAILAFVQPD